MKRWTALLFFICILFIGTVEAPAQSWVKKASKSVFTLKTFDAGGTLLGSSYGFFVGEHGECISSYEPFRGAYSATVIDAAGKEYAVEAILGANATYDVAKFRVTIKKSQPLAIVTQDAAIGTPVWMLPYRNTRSAIEGTVSQKETVGTGYSYYTAIMAMPPDAAGLPLLNEGGEVVGIMQKPATSADTLGYAVSAVFADSLRINGLSINDAVMRSINIKKALPTDLNQALLTLFVAPSSLDSTAYSLLLDDFVAQFPAQKDGYVARAQFAANGGRYADADRDIAQAISIGDATDEVHYSYSKLIYNKNIYKPQDDYPAWTFDRALAEAQSAFELNPLPAYQQQQAHILYAMTRYSEASDIYQQLFNSALRSPDIFVEAAQCKLMQADTIGHIAMLDSAVAMFNRPYIREAAPYIMARAQARIDAGRYREAVLDLNDYEQLLPTRVNDSFYYLRFQAEVEGRLYQQALNDISKAIQQSPAEATYYSEKASLEVRVGLYDEALATAQEIIQLAPEASDGYLFLGLAQCLKGDKTSGVGNLRRAKELGDNQADALIERYGN
ncbi:MAG: serine protease [Prevotella sp.]|nr:serine protease [Prevotella sp.]